MKFLKDLFTAITGIFRRNKLIVTHSGNFHADDVFAAATLLLLFNNKVRIIRTRDPEIIEKGDFVFDVGGVYDPELNRFDHHQTGGAGGRENGIPYASFGLVWKKFGIEICGSKETALYIDRELAEPIDAIDNGVEISKPFFSDVYPFTVTDVLDAFLPLPGDYSQSIDEIFLDVMNLAKRILIKEIEKEKKRQEIFPKVKEVYEVAPDKRLIVFDKKLWSLFPDELNFEHFDKDISPSMQLTIMPDSVNCIMIIFTEYQDRAKKIDVGNIKYEYTDMNSFYKLILNFILRMQKSAQRLSDELDRANLKQTLKTGARPNLSLSQSRLAMIDKEF